MSLHNFFPREDEAIKHDMNLNKTHACIVVQRMAHHNHLKTDIIFFHVL